MLRADQYHLFGGFAANHSAGCFANPPYHGEEAALTDSAAILGSTEPDHFHRKRSKLNGMADDDSTPVSLLLYTTAAVG